MPRTREADTTFLNVDLDVVSKAPLDPLVAALGRRVVVLALGREGRGRHAAHLELSRSPAAGARQADQTIQRFVRLIDALPRPARRLWDGALCRDFNLGVQAGDGPRAHEIRLSADTIRMASSIGAAVVVTTYGARLHGPPAKPRREAGRSKR